MTHIPVLSQEVLTALCIKHDGVYLDCTFGRGGHSISILKALGKSGRLIALDRDPDAVSVGRALELKDSRFQIFHTEFSALDQALILSEIKMLNGVLMDLGMSSPQLDLGERGFSFQVDGPLDMRMNPSQGQSAADWLAKAHVDEITYVLRTYGEERFSRRIARSIVMNRREKPIDTTLKLAQIISDAQPKQDQHKHPATRSFQAIRIHINQELFELEVALEKVITHLRPGGRLAIISFHSLEDRIVKRSLRNASRTPTGHPRMPLPDTVPKPKLRLISRAVKASAREIEQNPRARSAVLRIAERTEACA